MSTKVTTTSTAPTSATTIKLSLVKAQNASEAMGREMESLAQKEAINDSVSEDELNGEILEEEDEDVDKELVEWLWNCEKK